MHFVLYCLDKPDSLKVRLDARERHLSFVAETGVVRIGGPLLNDDGEMIGSLIVIEVDSRPAAEAWAKNDPYAQAGLFDSVSIRPWKRLMG